MLRAPLMRQILNRSRRPGATVPFVKVAETLGRAGPITRRELLVAGAALLGLGLLVLAGHVAQDGFSFDDWALSADEKYQGFSATVSMYLHIDHRPLVALYLPLVPAVFGDSAHRQLAWIAVAHVGMCWCVYLFLRTLGLERVHAGVVAVLVLVFPFSDASWLYVIGSAGTIAVSLYLLGSVAALRGLAAGGRRGWVLHGAAVLLFVASVLTYELALVAILLSGLLYLRRGSLRAVATRWAIDIAAMGLTVLLVTSRIVHLLPGQDVHSVLPLAKQVSHAKVIVHQARDVLGTSLLPFGRPHYTVALIGALLLTVIALTVRGLLPSEDGARAQLQRWLTVELGALCGVAAAWLVLVPADPYYSPDQAGVGNRINTFAGVCICVFVYAMAMLLATLLFRGAPRWRGWSACVGAAAGVAIGIGYLHRVDVDKLHWGSASALQRRELAVLRRVLPKPPTGARILLFNAPGYVAYGVPIFAAPWDLNGAVKLLWHDGSLSAYPVIAGTPVVCGAAAVVPSGGGGYEPQQQAPYGTAFFVDAGNGTVVRIRTRAQCTLALRQFTPGPLLL